MTIAFQLCFRIYH